MTNPDGSQAIENRDETGGFHKTETVPDTIEEEQVVSNRRQKRIARIHRFGFIVDLKPDMEIAEIAEGVFAR